MGAMLRQLLREYSTAPRTATARGAKRALRDFMPATPASAGPPEPLPPYLEPAMLSGEGRRVYVETYGCQMNVADSEIVRSVLSDSGYGVALSAETADVRSTNAKHLQEGQL